MIAGRIACCRLVNHIEYAPSALLRLEKRRDRVVRPREGRTPDRYSTLTSLDAASIISRDCAVSSAGVFSLAPKFSFPFCCPANTAAERQRAEGRR